MGSDWRSALSGLFNNRTFRNKGIEGYKRHFLYREYLRIISIHWPSIFIIENVKGLLSARVNGCKIFDHILEDLHDPLSILGNNCPAGTRWYKYRIFSLVKSTSFPFDSSQSGFFPSDYLVMIEDYGIPQARHRVILLGICEDMGDVSPETLTLQEKVNTGAVLDDLPVLRSGLSREEDSHESWQDRIRDILDNELSGSIYDEKERDVLDRMGTALDLLHSSKKYDRGGEFIPFTAGCRHMKDWYLDSRLRGVCNHTTKAHIPSDLHRYLYASCFAAAHGISPIMPEFPKKLWSEHKNAHKAKRSGNFSDSFRVQLASKPATTVMSHISKDGHYYIHYDPAQCRSLTVREAARLQTFPDNYFFEGPRTQQYIQVGNA